MKLIWSAVGHEGIFAMIHKLEARQKELRREIFDQVIRQHDPTIATLHTSSPTLMPADSLLEFTAVLTMFCEHYGVSDSIGDYATPGLYEFQFTTLGPRHHVIVKQVMDFSSYAS